MRVLVRCNLARVPKKAILLVQVFEGVCDADLVGRLGLTAFVVQERPAQTGLERVDADWIEHISQRNSPTVIAADAGPRRPHKGLRLEKSLRKRKPHVFRFAMLSQDESC